LVQAWNGPVPFCWLDGSGRMHVVQHSAWQ
jgi:hypothetical protein